MKEVQQAETLRLAEFFESMRKSSHRWYDGTPVHEKAAAELRSQHARIAELEADLEAVGAGGVQSLRKQAAAPQAAVPDGWKLVAVNPEFDNLMYWLDRCHENGHLEQCSDLIEPWLVFDYDSKTNFATHPTQQGLGERKDRDTIFFLAGWNGCNEGLDANEQFKKAEIAAQAKQGGAA